jgi:hypothetical protein
MKPAWICARKCCSRGNALMAKLGVVEVAQNRLRCGQRHGFGVMGLLPLGRELLMTCQTALVVDIGERGGNRLHRCWRDSARARDLPHNSCSDGASCQRDSDPWGLHDDSRWAACKMRPGSVVNVCVWGKLCRCDCVKGATAAQRSHNGSRKSEPVRNTFHGIS